MSTTIGINYALRFLSQTKEEVTGTLEAVQSMQVSSSHLHKARESYLSRCLEHERLRKEGANQKEVEKVGTAFTFTRV